MEQSITGRMIKAKTNMRCDLEAENHNPYIKPGGVAYYVPEGSVQGLFHGIECYRTARDQVEQLKKETGLK